MFGCLLAPNHILVLSFSNPCHFDFVHSLCTIRTSAMYVWYIGVVRFVHTACTKCKDTTFSANPTLFATFLRRNDDNSGIFCTFATGLGHNVMKQTEEDFYEESKRLRGEVMRMADALKDKLAQDIRGFIEKATYEGWREVMPGKHPETAYFAYFSREFGGNAYLCIRKIKNTGLFKPYAIIDQKTFDAEIQNLRKEKTLK